MHDYRRGAALFEEVRVVAASKRRVGRDCDEANLRGAKECGDEFRGIGKDQQDALSRPDAERGQRVTDAVDVLAQLPIGNVPSLARDGQTIAASFPDVTVHQIIGEVVHGAESTADPFPPMTARCREIVMLTADSNTLINRVIKFA
jgi:hypothetical protein